MKVLAFGEILWDVHGDSRTLGGAPANVAFHAKQLGADVSLISAVGQDPLGQEILQRLSEWNIDRSFVSISVQPTGTVIAQLDPAGQAIYVIANDCAWDNIPYQSELHVSVRAADAIVFGSLGQRAEQSRDTLRRVLGIVGSNTLRVFDVNLRPTGMDPTVIIRSINSCDLIKMNDAEVPYISECMGIEGGEPELSSALFEHGVKTVVITRGANGSSVITADSKSDMLSPEVQVEDTIGAGDAFTAATIIGLLRGDSISVTQKRASLVAAYVCSKCGATPILPSDLVR